MMLYSKGDVKGAVQQGMLYAKGDRGDADAVKEKSNVYFLIEVLQCLHISSRARSSAIYII